MTFKVPDYQSLIYQEKAEETFSFERSCDGHRLVYSHSLACVRDDSATRSREQINPWSLDLASW